MRLIGVKAERKKEIKMAYNSMFYQQYPQQPIYQGRYSPGFEYQPPQGASLKGRPVSSIDEAKAAQIDFDGSISLFPDIAHNKVYTKQVMLDGTASLLTYALVQEKQPEQPAYVTRDEFNRTIDELKQLAAKGAKNVQPKPASKSDDQLPSF